MSDSMRYCQVLHTGEIAEYSLRQTIKTEFGGACH